MKKVILILYIIILSLVLKFTLAIGPRKYNYIFTKSSNLISENINNIYLGTILDKGNLEKTKNVEKFDYYLDDNSLLITTKTHNDKIVGITIEQNVLNSTSKGIRIGSNIKDVIDMYGKNYYRRIEQGVDIIGYIDKKNYITIEFGICDDLVRFIILNYSNIE